MASLMAVGGRATTLRRERARGPPADGLTPRTERQAADRPTRWYRYAPGVVPVCLRSNALSICRLSSREGVEMEGGKQSRNPVKSNMLHNKDIFPIRKIVQQYGYSLDLRRNW